MIAVDTNILIYAHREDSTFHEAAADAVRGLAEGGEDWAIPWPCLHEFLAIATHPRIYDPPTALEDALLQVECWLEAPRLRLIGESSGYWGVLRGALESGKVIGPRVHDARIAALCVHHGVEELWSADRDFTRMGGIKVKNPLIGNTIA